MSRANNKRVYSAVSFSMYKIVYTLVIPCGGAGSRLAVHVRIKAERLNQIVVRLHILLKLFQLCANLLSSRPCGSRPIERLKRQRRRLALAEENADVVRWISISTGERRLERFDHDEILAAAARLAQRAARSRWIIAGFFIS